MKDRSARNDYSDEPNRDPLAVLTPEARATYMALPDCYRRFAIMELLTYEAGLKHPRRNQTIDELFAREKRRRDRFDAWRALRAG